MDMYSACSEGTVWLTGLAVFGKLRHCFWHCPVYYAACGFSSSIIPPPPLENRISLFYSPPLSTLFFLSPFVPATLVFNCLLIASSFGCAEIRWFTVWEAFFSKGVFFVHYPKEVGFVGKLGFEKNPVDESFRLSFEKCSVLGGFRIFYWFDFE